MGSVISSGTPILASDSPPSNTAYYQHWLCTAVGVNGSGRLHKYVSGEWVVMGDDLVSGTFEGTISKLKVLDGLVIEVELAE